MKSAFTLIELMVVIVIMGVLAAVAVPKLFGNIEKAKLSGVGETLYSFEEAVTRYYVTENTLPKARSEIDFLIEDSENLKYKVEEADEGIALTISVEGGECDGTTIASTVKEYTDESTLKANRVITSDNKDKCQAKFTKVEEGLIVLLKK